MAGKNPIQRNALIALAHFKEKDSYRRIFIELLQHDTRPMMRGTAAWALGKIAGKEAIKHLEASLEEEKDDSVKMK